MASESSSEPPQTHTRGESDSLRPLITDLNGDTSWLISFPRPTAERIATGKTYYHVVLDPWLTERSAHIFSPWIGQYTRPEPAAFTDGAAVDGLVRQIEEAAGSTAHADAGVDALCVCSAATDHMNRGTLTTFAPSIPVFTTPAPARMIPGWGHFERVIPMDKFQGPTWQSAHPGEPLPSWLSMLRVNTFILCLGIGFVWSHDDVHEALLYFPHGCDVDNDHALGQFLEASPRPRPLAIIHPVKDALRHKSLVTPGVRPGIKLYRSVRPAYWIQSSSALLEYSGPFFWGFRDQRRTLDWGLEMEKQESKEESITMDRPNLIEIGNGGQFVLK
ncbi:hypothetical protein F5X99DRAFT_404012 [Biscogniauxia marginata]|nr:hypothetical protein F5X99DRAFT_404012 [Biscogniauxia marginata]